MTTGPLDILNAKKIIKYSTNTGKPVYYVSNKLGEIVIKEFVDVDGVKYPYYEATLKTVIDKRDKKKKKSTITPHYVNRTDEGVKKENEEKNEDKKIQKQNLEIETETIQIFLLDLPKVPKSKHDLAKHMPYRMDAYRYNGAKVGGRNSAGLYGGTHVFYYALASETTNNNQIENHVKKQMLMIKQDIGQKFKEGEPESKVDPTKIHHNKIIAEFVAGRILQFLIGDSVAAISLAIRPNKNNSRNYKASDNVYIRSVYFDQYADLFQDIWRTNGKDPEAEGLDRPLMAGTLKKKWFVNGVLKSNGEPRYNNHEAIDIGSHIVFDDDVQSGNIGVLGPRYEEADPKHNIMKNQLKKDGGKLVRIDTGGALRRIERNTPEEVKRHEPAHLHAHKYIPPVVMKGMLPGLRPTSHYLEWPRSLRVSKKWVDEAERQANLSRKQLEMWLDATYDELEKLRGATGEIAITSKAMIKYAKEMSDTALAEVKQAVGEATFDSIQNGSRDPDQHQGIRETIFSTVKKYHQRITNELLDDLKEQALERKYSLCFKKVGTKALPAATDEDEYDFTTADGFDIEEVILENPEYFQARIDGHKEYHFRKGDQRYKPFDILSIERKKEIHELLTNKLNKKAAEVLARLANQPPHSISSSITDPTIAAFSSLSSTTFLRGTARPNTNIPLDTRSLPRGVEHFVVKKEVLHNKDYDEVYDALTQPGKSIKPVQHPQPSNQIMTFIASESNDPTAKKACFVEPYSSTGNHSGKLKQLQSEIDKNYIFAQALRAGNYVEFKHVNYNRELDLLISLLKKHSHAIVLDDEQLAIESISKLLLTLQEPNCKLKSSLVEDSAQRNRLAKLLYDDYNDKVTQLIHDANGLDDEVYTIPCNAYFKTAFTICLAMGTDNKKTLCIDSCKDPLMLEATALVCKAYGWKYKGKDIPDYSALYSSEVLNKVREYCQIIDKRPQSIKSLPVSEDSKLMEEKYSGEIKITNDGHF